MATSTSDEAIKEKILNIAKKNPKGISDKDITAVIPELSTAERVAAINKLLQQGSIDLFNQGGSLIYRCMIINIFAHNKYILLALTSALLGGIPSVYVNLIVLGHRPCYSSYCYQYSLSLRCLHINYC